MRNDRPSLSDQEDAVFEFDSNRSIKHDTLRGIGWSTIERWGSRLVSTATFIVIARHVSPTEFGVVALSGSIIALVAVVQQQGIATALVQRNAVTKTLIDTAFWASLLFAIVLAATLVLVARPVSSLSGEAELSVVLQMHALGLIVTSLSAVPTAILQRTLDFKPLALRRLIAGGMSGVVGITLAVQGAGVWALIAQGLTDSVVSVFIIWFAVDWRPSLHASIESWRELLKFGSRVTVMDILNVANTRLDDFLVGTFLGSTALGFYSVAYRFLVVITDLFVGVVGAVSLSAFSRLQHDPARSRRAMDMIVQWVCVVAFPAFFGLAAIAPEFIQVTFGSEWAPSVPVVRVLAVSGLLQALRSANGPMLIAFGRMKWIVRVSIVATVANVFGFAVGLHWGIVGVACGSVLRGVIVTPITFRLVGKLTEVSVRSVLRTVGSVAIAAAIMLGSIILFTSPLRTSLSAEMRLAGGVVCGVAVYASALRLLLPQLASSILRTAHVALLRR